MKLDLTRGKPPQEVIRLCLPMTTIVPKDLDMLNYGAIEGLESARKAFCTLVDADWKHTFVSGNGSLSVMRNIVTEALLTPLPGMSRTWKDLPYPVMSKPPSMLCPTPSYDRYRNIHDRYDIGKVPVPMRWDGPDMDMVEDLVVRDASIVGIWCVPVYNNPEGITYSSSVCHRLARMRTANPAFRIIWDKAYVEHHWSDVHETVPNMLELCREAGNEDRAFVIASTAKITCPDRALGIVSSSEANMEWYRGAVFVDNIGLHKLNQYQHVVFLGDIDGIRQHMARHREILKPKFDLVQEILSETLGHTGLATWTNPRGGYFVSVHYHGISSAAVNRRAEARGLTLTSPTACDPDGKDDSHQRLAPTYPPLDELRPALYTYAECVLEEAAAA